MLGTPHKVNVPYSKIPLGCYLCRFGDGVIVAYVFLTQKEMLKARPGLIVDLCGQRLFVGDIGPLSLGSNWRK